MKFKIVKGDQEILTGTLSNRFLEVNGDKIYVITKESNIEDEALLSEEESTPELKIFRIEV